ncbi:MAG TPA: hypothetical protein VF756_30175, partial [Thermoanaerobaculia bacterium]
QAAGVQVDSAVIPVLLGVESHRGLLSWFPTQKPTVVVGRRGPQISIPAVERTETANSAVPARSPPNVGRQGEHVTPSESVAKLLCAIEENAQADGASLLKILLNAGDTPEQAMFTVHLSPIAFGRYLLAGLGIRFSDTFLLLAADGSIASTGSLSAQPSFIEATKAVESWPSKTIFQALALRSAEVGVVNRALQAGSKPANLALAPVTIFLSSPLPGAVEKSQAHLEEILKTQRQAYLEEVRQMQRQKAAKPKWKFW